MNSKGAIFSIDAALALIPLFILLTTVANSGSINIHFSSDEIRISNHAQDTLEIMANYKIEDEKFTVLQKITDLLILNNESPESVADFYLNKTLGNMKYNLTEISQLNGKTIASNADMENADNLVIGVRNYGNYTFKLYIWQ